MNPRPDNRPGPVFIPGRSQLPALFLLGLLFTLSCTDVPSQLKNESPLALDTIYSNNAGQYIPDDNKGMNDSMMVAPIVELPSDSLYKYFDTVIVGEKIYFVSEGDILMSENEFRKKLFKQVTDYIPSIAPIHRKSQKLYLGYDAATGDTIKWRKFPIRFCIDRNSFRSKPGGYDIVRNALQTAARDWNNVCRVNFQYLPSFDAAPPSDISSVDFVVTYVGNSVKPYQAAAFYPHEFPNSRQLIIFRGFWISEDDKAGTMRHEFGHILGFRHEHASDINVVPTECKIDFPEDPIPFPVKPVITYDKYSVMHYFCGGAGTREMRFSQSDSIGFKLAFP